MLVLAINLTQGLWKKGTREGGGGGGGGGGLSPSTILEQAIYYVPCFQPSQSLMYTFTTSGIIIIQLLPILVTRNGRINMS